MYFVKLAPIALLVNAITTQKLSAMKENDIIKENKHAILFLTNKAWKDFQWFNNENGKIYKKIKKLCGNEKEIKKLVKKITNEDTKQEMVFNPEILILKSINNETKSIQTIDHAKELISIIKTFKKTYQHVHIITSSNDDGPCIIGLASQLLNREEESIKRIESKVDNKQEDNLFQDLISLARLHIYQLLNPETEESTINNSNENQEALSECFIDHVVIIGKHNANYAFNSTTIKHVHHIAPNEEEEDINQELIDENKQTIHKKKERTNKYFVCMQQSKPYVEIALSLFMKALPVILSLK